MDDISQYQTFWRRFGASLVDSAVLAPVALATSAIAAALRADPFDDTSLALDVAAGIAVLVYSVFMHGRWGQPLGKMALGVKVVSASDGSPITYRQALLRDLPQIVTTALWAVALFFAYDEPPIVRGANGEVTEVHWRAFAPLLGYAAIQFAWTGIELLTLAFSRRRRSVHDFIAGTVVIKTGHKGQPWASADGIEVPFGPQLHEVVWQRVWGGVLDWLAWAAVALPFAGVLAATASGTPGRVVSVLFLAVSYAVYDVAFHYATGRTPGKWLVGLRVTRLDGGRLSLKQAVVRATGEWIQVASVLVGAVSAAAAIDNGFFNVPIAWSAAGLACMLATPYNQAFHDLLAGTMVVRAQEREAFSPAEYEQRVGHGW